MSDGPDLSQMLQTAQKVQQELTRVQEGLARKQVEGSAGGGMVVATVNGKQQLLSIKIEREIIDADEAEMLQDLVVAAVNQALAKASELAQQEMAQITGGMINIPGLF